METRVERDFNPVPGKNYESRTAMITGGETFTEILVEGAWWRVRKHPDNPHQLLLTDPSSPEDPNTMKLG